MENVLFDFISRYMTLSDQEWKAIVEVDIFKTFKKGTLLLKEGQYSQEGYFVLKGCIRCFYLVDGEEKTTAFYTEMEGVTPPCVISKNPSEFNLSCVEDSIVTVSNPAMEDEMFEKFPRFEKLCRIVSEELLVEKQTSFDEFKTSSAEQRYLKLLHTRPDLLQRVPQYQIASFLGITPQSLSRMRSRIVENRQ